MPHFKQAPHPLGYCPLPSGRYLGLLDWARRTEIIRLLRLNRGNMLQTAVDGGIGRQTLYNLVKKFEISRAELWADPQHWPGEAIPDHM